jgi:hypothetical protein
MDESQKHNNWPFSIGRCWQIIVGASQMTPSEREWFTNHSDAERVFGLLREAWRELKSEDQRAARTFKEAVTRLPTEPAPGSRSSLER